MEEYLGQRKAEHVREVDRWREAFKAYRESAKMDQMRIGFLADAGVTNVRPQVRSEQALMHGLAVRRPHVHCALSVLQSQRKEDPRGIVQVLQPLRPCMRIVVTAHEAKAMLKSALTSMERVRLVKVEAQRAGQEAKMRKLLAQKSARLERCAVDD